MNIINISRKNLNYALENKNEDVINFLRKRLSEFLNS